MASANLHARAKNNQSGGTLKLSEKLKPTYDLGSFKTMFCSSEDLFISVTAAKTAAALGCGSGDIAAVIRRMESAYFQKSMASHGDHWGWQDVYSAPWNDERVVWVKFTADAVTGFSLPSSQGADHG